MVQLHLALGFLSFAGYTIAFPALAEQYAKQSTAKRSSSAKRVNGVSPGFDATAQKIETTGDHVFVPPGHDDLRGPCPGLNALANHNYLPHDGVATIDQFVTATNQVFGMGLDLATFLSVYGAVMDGDLTSWSIGGPPPSSLISGLSNLLSDPQGISGSHNKYESDVSPTRGDLYEYGDDYSLRLSQFMDLYNKQAGVSDSDANYGLGLLTDFRAERFQESIDGNPYFFNGPFSGVAVQPAAYTFIYRFMSNKSEAYPEGLLNKEVLKSFFAITGDEGAFTYNAGWEKIPDNWYKRAIGDEYTIPFFATDLNAAALEYPQFASVGGNTGKTDSFTGVDISNLTGGVYNSQNLLQGNNLACFGFQFAAQAAPDILKGLFKDVTSAVSELNDALGNAISQLSCPQLENIDESQFAQFPGYTKLSSSGSY